MNEFISLSLSVKAKDIDIGERDDQESSRNSVKALLNRAVKETSSLFQGKRTEDNESRKTEKDNTILKRQTVGNSELDTETIKNDKIQQKSLVEDEVVSRTKSDG